MKRIPGILWILAVALIMTALAPAVLAQEEHGEFGVYADMTRLHNLNDDNFWGVGGRLGFNLSQWAQLEGDFAYDFSQQFSTFNGTTLTTNTLGNLRLLHGELGPKFQTGIGPVKAFVVLKGGFMNFDVSPLSGSGFRGQVGTVPGNNTDAVFYPGGGLEFFAGRIGFRVEAGDEMYFQNGANHNLRVSFGPQIRF
jgi:Outer membrane protein beta-barrel domain